MSKLLKSARDVAVMALVWAVGWAFAGFMVEAVNEIAPDFPTASMVDVWPTLMAVGGLLAGLVFSLVLWVGERRTFEEAPLARLAVWGAIAGLVMGATAVAIGAGGKEFADIWPRAAWIAGSLTVLGVLSAIASALMSRLLATRHTI